MPMPHVLATLVVFLHLAFVVFDVIGGVLALRWPTLAFVHVPAAAWAIYVEWAGVLCPLTPLENSLRTAAGLEAYAGDFVAEYVFPVLYPNGLTRTAQMVMGAAVLAFNLIVYVAILSRRGSTGVAE
ncbi:MAG: DUF2784 domain-containing protein [Acidobacteria bacterium]|nr:MAG: DUF2784 domain-containing protein [Acidobacteriota bacterium]